MIDPVAAQPSPIGARGRTRPPATGLSPFPGLPFPLGATVTDNGTNFAVVAETDAIELCLVDASGAERRWEMHDRTYGVWHAFVPGVGPGQRYGYRTGVDRSKVLLDPYARRIDVADYDLAAAATHGTDTLGKVPLGVVTEPLGPVAPGPAVPWEHTVIYEAHVKGLTAANPDIPAELRGTYAGVAHPAVVEHLQSLRVTTLELLPVHAFVTEPGLAALGRRNYWGYSTLSWFAVHPGYATRPGREREEFAAMVDTLHRAGIEVVLDVVYNHSCEGGTDLPITLSLRGLAPNTYYLGADHDITGTGNAVNPARLPVVRLVTDSLRYWAGELGVDGFRFDLASVHGRPNGGPFDPGSALLSAIAADPLLSTRKLIAEPWDATSDGYAVGRFGAQWAEWNDHFRDDVRDFWRGHRGVRGLASRLAGSEDLFGWNRRPWASINFVTAHDGFTLRDVVSYGHKHNEANGEENRDGTDNNRSANYGVEGETDDPDVRSVRLRQARNILATLLLSTGTPMITMGDELWRTQGGNNNPYCQDGPQVWLDWQAVPDGEPAALLAFTRRTLALRAQAPALHQGDFFGGRPPADDHLPDLVWFGPDGTQMTPHDWYDDGRRVLGMWVNGRDVRGHGPVGQPLFDDSWLLVLHAGEEPVRFTLPDVPFGDAFVPELDTGTPSGVPDDATPLPGGEELVLPPRVVWLLRALRA